MTKKKTQKRKSKAKKQEKLWGLEVNTFPKYARNYMDYDYIEKLKTEDPKAAKWLSTFNEEYYGNTFRPRTSGEKTVHKRTKKQKRAIYGQTNERIRDMYNKNVKLGDINNDFFDVPSSDNVEDYMADFLDAKREFEKGKKYE